MRRGFRYIVVSFLLAFVAPVIAQAACSTNGYSLIFINGIFSTEKKAQLDKQTLKEILPKQINNQPLTVQLAYNQSHLAGAGDLFEAYFPSFDTYDLNTILLQIHGEVTTRKLLIVGHSQGAMYANKMYEYLVTHGEPSTALAVYAVATPDSYVAGGGRYLTYTLDPVINRVRLIKGLKPLPPNIDLVDLSSSVPVEGHSFTNQYLAGAPDRITSDIKAELSALQATSATEAGDCFTPPEVTLGRKVEGVALAVADPVADVARAGVAVTYQGTTLALNAAVGLAKTGYSAAASALASIGGFFSSPQVNPAAPENYEKNFQIVKSLYGSSLDKADYEELNGVQGGAVATALTPVVSTRPPPVHISLPSPTPTLPIPATTTPAQKSSTVTPHSTSTPQIQVIMPTGGGSSLPPPPDPAATSSPPALFTASTTPPTLTVAECASSLNPNFCLIATTTATPSWTAVVDAVQYGIQVNGVEVATTTGLGTGLTLQDNATSTIVIVAYDVQNNTATSTAQTVTVSVPFTPQHSSISDSFDTFNSLGWQPITSNNKVFDFDDGSDGSCFQGGCVIGNDPIFGLINIAPLMYFQTAPALSNGAYTLYAKARLGFNGPIPVITVCDSTYVGCINNPNIAGIHFFNAIPLDDTWHQYYIAWRQGATEVQQCVMQDDTNPNDCIWVSTTFALGSTFDGIALWTQVGYRNDLGGNFWFDELVAQ
jgi:hypothetical protein